MHRTILVAAAGLGCWLACGTSRAAEPDGYVYVVNAAAHPLILVIDDTHLDLPKGARVTQPVSAGRHGLAAVLGTRTVSQLSVLEPEAAGVDKGLAYWCFIGGESKGAPRLIPVAPDECATLVRAGEPAAPPLKPKLAPPIAR